MSRENLQKLFEDLKKGDKQVLESIYIKHRQTFLKFGSNYNIDNEELMDIYQDSILAFMDNVKNGKINTLNCSIKTYLFSIGKYIIFKKLKRVGKVEELPIDLDRLKSYTQDIENEDVYGKEEMELFKSCFKLLGKQCQQLLQMFYYRGYTLEDIQKSLNYSNYNVVKSQKSRCLKHLRELVNSKKQNGN